MTTEVLALAITVEPADVVGSEAVTSFRTAPRGRIRKLLLQFPTGCNGVVHVVVEDREGRIAPITGGDFALSGISLPLDVDIPIAGNDPALRLVGWADAGATYSHRIDVLAVVETAEVV